MPLSVQDSIQVQHAVRSPLGHISLAGYMRIAYNMTRQPARVLGSYAVVYIVEGKGVYEDARGHSQEVGEGDLLLVFPDLPHTYGPHGDTLWTELYLVFDGPIFDMWRSTGLLDPAHPIHHLIPIANWLSRFDSILGTPRQPGYGPSLEEVCRLQLVLAEALRGGTKGGAYDDEMAWVSRACALLEADLERDLDLHWLAQEVNMSYGGFRKRFQRHMGMPPARYRSVRMIDRACELMQRGDLTDRQIANRLGFCDEFYFSRRFKQITGSSPSEWRSRVFSAR